MTETLPPENIEQLLPDDVTVRHWFAFYTLGLLAAGIPLAILVAGHDWQVETWWRSDMSLSQRWEGFIAAFSDAPDGIKLLGFAIYISLCCTFLPLPANAVVAALSMQNVAIGEDIWTTSLVVAAIGGLASTVANLNDYHLFTWMLRHRHVAKIRHTRLYKKAALWFARGPFSIVLIFNILPIPIDVVRMLATVYRYPRLPFAAANFAGRFIRYAALAAITYALGRKYGWISPVALLAVAIVLGVARLVADRYRKRRERSSTQTE